MLRKCPDPSRATHRPSRPGELVDRGKVRQALQRTPAKGSKDAPPPKGAEVKPKPAPDRSTTAAPAAAATETASAPTIQQLNEVHVTEAPPDPELVERARQYRVNKGMLGNDAFRRNVVVIKYRRAGTVDFHVTDNKGLHGELEAISKLAQDDPHWRQTEILEIYSERQPCPNCASHLSFLRRSLNRIADAQRRAVINFRVYFTVPTANTYGQRRALLEAQYRAGAGRRAPSGTGTMFSFVFMAWLGYRHQSAQESRAATNAERREGGYAEPHSYRGGFRGALDRAGDVIYDPFGTGERGVPLRSRVDMPKWRGMVRRVFGRAGPGAIRVFRWDHIEPEREYEQYVLYLCGGDRRWYIIGLTESLESAHWLARWMLPGAPLMATDPKRWQKTPPSYTPDINEILDPATTDERVWDLIEPPPQGEFA